MSNGLIGYSGFVGSTLLRQSPSSFFDLQYRSTNIDEILGLSFDQVICAGAPAQKWIANKDPEADRKKIDGLIERLSTISCNTFVLVSTVDVFNKPSGVDEESLIEEGDLHAYGLHRRLLEKFVESHFENYLIVRLPGLVGPGLKKNVIYDFLNDNNLHTIDSRGVFQFYPMVNLWFDIQTALNAGLKYVHLTSEPIAVADIAEKGFGMKFTNSLENIPASYDMKTRHANLFGSKGDYQYSARELVQAVRAYAQSETRKSEADDGAHR